MTILTNLDREVESRIKFFEKKYGCIIFPMSNGCSMYMNVAYMDGTCKTDVYLCPYDCNKYELISAIREYFIKNERKEVST